MASPLHSRTTYRDDFCHEHRRAATFGGAGAAGPDADSCAVSVRTTIRNRELEVSAGPLGPGLTLSTYRDAFCAPHLGARGESMNRLDARMAMHFVKLRAI
jgi:hypothetical protein